MHGPFTAAAAAVAACEMDKLNVSPGILADLHGPYKNPPNYCPKTSAREACQIYANVAAGE